MFILFLSIKTAGYKIDLMMMIMALEDFLQMMNI